jgi:hypothetical protein
MIPLIFIHKNIGLAEGYLEHTLLQAKSYNNHVILISDNTDKYDFVDNYNLDDFYNDEKLIKLRKNYIHLCSNPEEFELINLERWFILNQLIKKHNFKKCCLADSDTLFYCNIEKELKQFEEFDLTLSNGISANILFLNHIEIIEEFCNFINYNYEFNKNDLIKTYDNYIQKGQLGGISDMTFFSIFKNQKRWIEISTIKDNITFDANINMPLNYIQDEELECKKIEIIDGVPFGTLKDDLIKIRFKSLHLQGQFMKQHITKYITYS